MCPELEADYEAWVRRHPQGFVINVKSDVLVWHRADCGHIRPDGTLHFITDAAIKACSLNPATLAPWAKQQRADLEYCKDCRTKWLGEQRALRQGQHGPDP